MENMKTSGVIVVKSDAPSPFHVAQRGDTSVQIFGSAPHVTPHVGVSPPAVVPATVAPPDVAVTDGKKKRGRPRKYGPDGSVTRALSPRPISSSAPPPLIDFSSEKPRAKIRPVGPASKQYEPRMHMDNLGEWFSSAGANFTPHIITVSAGEDVTNKVISFSQQGPRAICVLSANGVISSVTFHQPDASGGTLTYEGRFEILTLSGSYMSSEIGGIRNRTGGMSVSLAGPDGRVIGGGVAGLLVAASPVQIVIGSFLTTGSQTEPKPKKVRTESMTTIAPTAAVPISNAQREDHSGMQNPMASVQDVAATPLGRQNPTTPAQNVSATPLAGNSWSACQHDPKKKLTDINVPLPE